MTIVIKEATLINEGTQTVASVVIEGERIAAIYTTSLPIEIEQNADEVIEANGLWLIPGAIDDQVHFREPGLTHKGCIATESAAAVAGGITSYMEMPNTIPQTTSIAAWEDKNNIAATTSIANYSFFLGATNSNLDQLLLASPTRTPGIKVFMGSSTGNMLVDNTSALTKIFAEVELPIAVHCEKEEIIKNNILRYTQTFGEDLPIEYHPLIRSAEACYVSSAEAVALATKYNTRLHLFHLSTSRELELLSNDSLDKKRITGEVCVHHLYFDDRQYATLGNRIKWNPAIKTSADRVALVEGVNTNKIDVIATDHAPHLLSEKEGSCLKAASGGPLLQHSLLTMIELSQQGEISLPKIVEKMCHAPAQLYNIAQRGYIRTGYYADLVLVDPNTPTQVSETTLYSRCGWSPFDGHTFSSSIIRTFVNGTTAYKNGIVDTTIRGKALLFER